MLRFGSQGETQGCKMNTDNERLRGLSDRFRQLERQFRDIANNPNLRGYGSPNLIALDVLLWDCFEGGDLPVEIAEGIKTCIGYADAVASIARKDKRLSNAFNAYSGSLGRLRNFVQQTIGLFYPPARDARTDRPKIDLWAEVVGYTRIEDLSNTVGTEVVTGRYLMPGLVGSKWGHLFSPILIEPNPSKPIPTSASGLAKEVFGFYGRNTYAFAGRYADACGSFAGWLDGRIAEANKRRPIPNAGRKPKTNSKEETRIVEAWETGRFRTYAELDRHLGKPEGYSQKTVDRVRNRGNRRTN
jgi:hypothetical protein